MGRFGLIGPTYSSLSVIADCQRTMNFYPESVESGMGKSALALYGTPGLSLFSALPETGVRASLQINGRTFKVCGASIYEIFSNGTYTNWGSVGNDSLPAQMRTNGIAGNQVLIYSAGALYVLNLNTNVLIRINTLQGIPSMIAFVDGYGVCLLANSNKFQVSNLEDFTTWNPLGVQQVSVFPENASAIVEAFRQLWVFGTDGHAQVYYNSGANQFTPFDVISGAFMEEGIDAPFSLCVLDNAPFWLGGNQGGNGIAWRANGYSPMRISNHAIESAWAAYPKISDAVGYTYRDQGHTFWVLRFPSANSGYGATWVYDTATQMWHERGFWSKQGPTGYSAHLSTSHCFSFGQHLVGDWNSGNVYAMSIGTYSDNGAALRRFRRCPHISSEQAWIYYNELQIDLETGIGPEPPLTDGAGNPIGPQIMLRWSDDGGKTWSNEHWVDFGQMGNYKARARWLRMGRARDRVFEFAISDPVKCAVIDGYLEASPGFQKPVERYNKQMAKIA